MRVILTTVFAGMLLLGSAGAGWADPATFSDDFNRADGPLGSDW